MSLAFPKIKRSIFLIITLSYFGFLNGQTDDARINDIPTDTTDIPTDTTIIKETSKDTTKIEESLSDTTAKSIPDEVIKISDEKSENLDRKKFFTKKKLIFGTVGLVIPVVYILVTTDEKLLDEPIGFPPAWKDNP